MTDLDGQATHRRRPDGPTGGPDVEVAHGPRGVPTPLDVLMVGVLLWWVIRVFESFDGERLSVFRESFVGVMAAALVVVAVAAGIVAVVALVSGRTQRSSVVAAAVAGCAAPVLAIGAVGVDLGSADSAVLVSSNAFVRAGNVSWLLDSQEAAVPHLVYGVAIPLGASIDRLVLVPVVLTFVLALAVGAAVHRRTGDGAMAAVAGLVLVGIPPLSNQAARLPLYPLFALTGLAGVWAMARWVEGSSRRWWVPTGAAALVAVAVATHGAGLYYGPLVMATIILATDRPGVRRWFLGMVAVGVANLPWLVSHLAVGGLSRISTPRDSWFLSNGHQLAVNERFWELPVGSRWETLANMPLLYLEAGGVLALPIMAAAVWALREHSVRRQILAVVAIVILWTPIVLARSASFERYYYPILPAVVVLAGIGASRFTRTLGDGRRRAVVIGVLVVALAQFLSALVIRIDERVAGEQRLAEISMVAGLVDDRGVVGARSFQLNLVDVDAATLHHDLLDEDDVIGLYRWDRTVVERLVDDEGVGWLLLTEPRERWERAYNRAWMEPAFGVEPIHLDVVDQLDCAVFVGEVVSLFDLERCLGR